MTYDYECEACGHQWEVEQKITDPKLTDCPRCKAPKAKRLVSAAPGFTLKGSGWAKDGYGS